MARKRRQRRPTTQSQFDAAFSPTWPTLDELRVLLDAAFESGWQPADVAHDVKRTWTVRARRLIVALIADHARRHDAPHRAPHPWLDQLSELGVFDASASVVRGGQGDILAAWSRSERLEPDEAVRFAAQVRAHLAVLHPLPVAIAPPSRWGATNVGLRDVASAGEVDERALRVIRGLLAKAEATTFEAEAAAFTSKAQQLMSRHSIDAAVVAHAATGERLAAGVRSRRVHIDHPYADEKASFLAAIARVNGAKSVWLPYAGLCTVIGFPVDLQLIDLLFTSLLVQATRASAAATTADRSLSTASFRRAFLISFAHRVAERLDEARVQVTTEYGTSLVPVLAERDAAVEEVMDEIFPDTTPMRRRTLNAAGWYAGRAAADVADIGTTATSITAG